MNQLKDQGADLNVNSKKGKKLQLHVKKKTDIKNK